MMDSIRAISEQSDRGLSADRTQLVDGILKILMVEERIEEKLDAVLARGSSYEVAKSSQMSSMQARSATPHHCVAALGKSRSFSSDRSEMQLFGRESCLSPRNLGSGASVRMRSEFQVLIDESAAEDRIRHTKGSLTGPEIDNQAQDNGAFGTGRFSDYLPINPNSVFSVGWSLINIFVLVAELTSVPYVLAWDIDLGVIPACTAAFWSSDACISLITGTYNAEGKKNPFRISARRYLSSWFPLDSSILLLDWMSIFEMAGGPSVKLLRFCKLARMWRVVAILRYSKLNRNYNRILDAAPYANMWRMVFRVFYLCVCIILFLHYVACFWFFLGKDGPTDTGRRWLDVQFAMSDGTMIDVSTGYQYFQYLICFHWSVGAFTLGNMEVGYANSFERAFGVAFIVLSLLFGSVLISVLSAILVDHQTKIMETTVKLRIVDRFLRENEVSDMLALRVQKVCLERLKVSEKLTFSDATALNNLPAWLYKELRYEIIGRFLKQHDLFNCWSTLDISFPKDYCVHGVDMVFLNNGDELFKANVDSEDAYFFSSGELTYSKSEGDLLNTVLVPAGTWLSEASLWSPWRHVGTCEAQSPCKIALANYKTLAQHVRGHPFIRALTLSYCQCFCRGLAQARPPSSQFPDDMCVPLTKFAEMLMHFPNDLRTLISTHAINVSKLGNKNAAELQREVNAGKCDLYISIEGALMRTVHVMALMLQDVEGRVLYRVGEVVSTAIANDGEDNRHLHAIPELKLPGLKQERAEFLADTLKRLVDRKMEILRDRFEHINTVFEEEVAFSKTLGVKTLYLRAKMVCSLREDFPAKLVSRHANPADQNLALVRRADSMGSFRSANSRVNNSDRLHDAMSMSTIPLYVIFEGTRPFIYAWLPQTMVDDIRLHRRDEVLKKMLSRVDFDIIQGAHEDFAV